MVFERLFVCFFLMFFFSDQRSSNFFLYNFSNSWIKCLFGSFFFLTTSTSSRAVSTINSRPIFLTTGQRNLLAIGDAALSIPAAKPLSRNHCLVGDRVLKSMVTLNAVNSRLPCSQFLKIQSQYNFSCSIERNKLSGFCRQLNFNCLKFFDNLFVFQVAENNSVCWLYFAGLLFFRRCSESILAGSSWLYYSWQTSFVFIGVFPEETSVSINALCA